jgi:hypothetical protein
MTALFAALMALTAIAATPHDEPPRFVATVLAGRPVITNAFVGLEGRAADGEGWYAGLAVLPDGARGRGSTPLADMPGPYRLAWRTGP